MEVTYRESDIGIRVIRVFEQDDLVERYTFTNEGGVPVSIYDIGIYTPFNDNYPDAEQCINTRANAHIWEGGSAAYVKCHSYGRLCSSLGTGGDRGCHQEL